MNNQGRKWLLILSSMVLVIGLFAPSVARAHCDGMDGPVVKAAQKAIATGNVNFILIWVQKPDETEIRNSFQKTLAVRKQSPEARELADMYFFETAVRLHRAGEGEPYTGLKSAGRDFGPAIPAADKAIDAGSLDPLLKLFPASAHAAIRQRFDAAFTKKSFPYNDVDAGREYVKAYVEFIHYVEELYHADAKGEGHDPHTGKP